MGNKDQNTCMSIDESKQKRRRVDNVCSGVMSINLKRQKLITKQETNLTASVQYAYICDVHWNVHLRLRRVDNNMMQRILLLLLNCCSVVLCNIQEHWIIITPFAAGVGNIVDQIVADMPEDCTLMCAVNTECTSLNYIVSNNTCSLLHVQDVLDD